MTTLERADVFWFRFRLRFVWNSEKSENMYIFVQAKKTRDFHATRVMCSWMKSCFHVIYPKYPPHSEHTLNITIPSTKKHILPFICKLLHSHSTYTLSTPPVISSNMTAHMRTTCERCESIVCVLRTCGCRACVYNIYECVCARVPHIQPTK